MIIRRKCKDCKRGTICITWEKRREACTVLADQLEEEWIVDRNGGCFIEVEDSNKVLAMIAMIKLEYPSSNVWIEEEK